MGAYDDILKVFGDIADIYTVYAVVKVTRYQEDVNGEDEIGIYANQAEAEKIARVLNSRRGPESRVSYKVVNIVGDKEKIHNSIYSTPAAEEKDA